MLCFCEHPQMAYGRHMFFDGVFDNLDGMKYIKPGTFSIMAGTFPF